MDLLSYKEFRTMTSPRIEEEELTGGGVNHVVRIGTTVRRPTGHWTPAVHALLNHLVAVGFTGAPASHGIDDEGREILDFLPGQVPDYPLPEYAQSDEALLGVAALLRDYHEATAGFAAPSNVSWYFAPQSPAEVICHGDIAPYNCVFRDWRPVAFIDFDTAHPGPRIWDVAYAAYRFVPLADPHREVGIPAVHKQARRLRLFADAYRLGDTDRSALTNTALARLDHLIRHMHDQADAGNEAFAAHIATGDDTLYRADAEHIARHQAVFQAALMTPADE
ncbi:phosphotransferase enzyme family protein [Planotetraspora sp. GP83]|uniref:phosphotransferase enzyme family protein n=1 Tax=Planotetraspora sp. GP83 TaxID=3156264 RepID=UPI003518571D